MEETNLEEMRARIEACVVEAKNAEKALEMRKNRLYAAKMALATATAPFKTGDVVTGLKGDRMPIGVVIAVIPPPDYKDPDHGAEYSYAMRSVKKDGGIADVYVSPLRVWASIPTLQKTGEMIVPAEALLA